MILVNWEKKKKKKYLQNETVKHVLRCKVTAKRRIYEERLNQYSREILRAGIVRSGPLCIWVHFHRMQLLSQYYFDKE